MRHIVVLNELEDSEDFKILGTAYCEGYINVTYLGAGLLLLSKENVSLEFSEIKDITSKIRFTKFGAVAEVKLLNGELISIENKVNIIES